MANMKFVLNITSIPNLKNIRRIPGIEEYETKRSGKLYKVKYFVDDGRGPKMISFSSKDKSFSTLHSFDI